MCDELLKYLKELEKNGFYGEIVLQLNAGKIVNVKTTQSFNAQALIEHNELATAQ